MGRIVSTAFLLQYQGNLPPTFSRIPETFLADGELGFVRRHEGFFPEGHFGEHVEGPDMPALADTEHMQLSVYNLWNLPYQRGVYDEPNKQKLVLGMQEGLQALVNTVGKDILQNLELSVVIGPGYERRPTSLQQREAYDAALAHVIGN